MMAEQIEFLLAGTVITAIGLIWLWPRFKRKRGCTAQTVGTPIGSHTEKHRKSKSTEHMTFTYFVDGVTYQQETEIGNLLAMLMIFRRNHNEITVFYDPANPQRCYTSKDAVNGTAWGFLIVGIMLLVAAFL